MIYVKLANDRNDINISSNLICNKVYKFALQIVVCIVRYLVYRI